MKFEWDKKKNRSNIQKHGIDLIDSIKIFEHVMVIKLDERSDYGENRLTRIVHDAVINNDDK